MKIGISCYPTYGGSGVVATELAMALAAGGDEVHVISYALPSRLALLEAAAPEARLFYHQVVVPHYPLFEYPPYSLALATKIVEITRHHQLDLVHVHYAVPNAVSAILARTILQPLALPVVTTLHGTDITLVGNDPSFMETTRWGIDQSDAVTTVSASLRNSTRDIFGITRPIEVVPNFIDPSRYLRTANGPGARRWAKPGERVLVHISNFRPVKRVDDVVEVFHRLRGRFPVRLLMVGDGPERARVEQRCRQHGSCGEVSFIGNLPLVEEVLVNADLFLLPSESESFGLAALEALACKVPVIATRAGGIPEVIADGECGLLYPVGDVAGMAEGAARLLGDEPLRQRFGEAARQRAVELFSTRQVVAQYRALYESVLAPV
ncbi:MAG TPA: N-acetyl-alpha-D-glucosaminyl L-malate synthase BshA [Thermoanaerobaculia bacterium]|jgi:N-acetyl-alpha-D-glucosaminyl L-malate synthase BshA|nr:N-acetyl-alpha-D-glucosaminyl L-malate synthase BshA [Thermoanaerobaculia bacterium]